MKKYYAITAIVVVLLGTGYFAAHKGLDRPDEILIREVFSNGEQAVETKDLRKAMSCVSKNYKGALGRNYDGLSLIARQAFQNQGTYDIQLDAPEVAVNGNQATAATKVTVVNVAEGNREPMFSGGMTFVLTKEPVKRYYIFPVDEWKISGFEGLVVPDVGFE